MVIVTDQVQDPMNNHPVQFIGECGSIMLGIVPDRIDADEKVSAEAVALTVVESDDICEIIMLEIFHVHVQDIIVRTENDGDVSETADFALRDELEPAARQAFLLESKFRIFGEIRDHILKFVQIYK